jgi:hypothetical protein
MATQQKVAQEKVTQEKLTKEPKPGRAAVWLGLGLIVVGFVLAAFVPLLGTLLWVAGVISLAAGLATRMESPMMVGGVIAGAGILMAFVGGNVQGSLFWGAVAGIGGLGVIAGLAIVVTAMVLRARGRREG